MNKRKYVSLGEQMETAAKKALSDTSLKFADGDVALLTDYLNGEFSKPVKDYFPNGGTDADFRAKGVEIWNKLEQVEAILLRLTGWVWEPHLLCPQYIERQSRKAAKRRRRVSVSGDAGPEFVKLAL